jgi:hypothetical protein
MPGACLSARSPSGSARRPGRFSGICGTRGSRCARPAGADIGPGERDAIIAAGRAGKTPPATAAEVGRSVTAVRGIFRDAGLARSVHAADDQRQVRQLHAQGLRGIQIDQACGWPEGRAGRIQQGLGLDPRRPDPPARQAARLYRDLGTVAAVAARLRRSERVISRVLKSAGVAVPGPRGGPRDPGLARLEPHLDAIRAARTGPRKVPLQELAARYGVSYATMANFVKQRQVVSFRRVSREQHERMVALRAEGVSKAEIGRQTGFSATTVDKHVT